MEDAFDTLKRDLEDTLSAREGALETRDGPEEYPVEVGVAVAAVILVIVFLVLVSLLSLRVSLSAEMARVAFV